MRPNTGPRMALGTPERRWPKNTKPVRASAITGFRKFESASKPNRTAARVRNQPRFRSIGFLYRRWKSSTPRLNRCPDGFRGEAPAPVPNFDQLRRFDIGARKVLSHEEQRLATQAGG